MNAETMIEAMSRLAVAGYTDCFWAVSSGLRAHQTGKVHEPERMVIEDFVRFEADTDPSHEAIVFALRCTLTGTKGTYIVGYGPNMGARDAEIVERLQSKSRQLRS
jgi:hypothetical protein